MHAHTYHNAKLHPTFKHYHYKGVSEKKVLAKAIFFGALMALVAGLVYLLVFFA